MSTGPIAILGSGVTLGVYVPALILKRRLEALGTACQLEMLEDLLDDRRRQSIHRTKRAFHQSFPLALKSQKLTGDIADRLDPGRVERCLSQWRRSDVQGFCVFSGFWLPVVERYAPRPCAPQPSVHLCYMDAVPSTSWNPFVDRASRYVEHRLFDGAKREVALQLAVSTRERPIAWEERENRFVVHGGGWGLGSYRSASDALSSQGFHLDLICYEADEARERPAGHRYFMIDPCWMPWERAGGAHVFPPFAEVTAGPPESFTAPEDHPHVYDLIERARGVISKPGGATLLDSFCAATPLVFLPETFGDYEQRNGELWQELGFGVEFSAWQKSGYSLELLRQLHQNILTYKAEQTPRLLELEVQRATQDSCRV